MIQCRDQKQRNADPLLSWLVRKTDQTILCLISFVVPNILGTILLIHLTPSPFNRRYLILAMYATQSFQAIGPALFVLAARNTAGATKKSISYAIVYTGWGVGNALSPQLFREEWAPRYVPALKLHLGLYAAWIGVALILRGVLRARQRAKERGLERGEGLSGVRGDITDRRDPYFEYSL